MSDLDLIFSGNDQRVEKFQFKGKDVSVTLREIGWAEKNKVLGLCFKYQADGNISFDFDRYNKEMLRRLITKIAVGDSEVPAQEMNEIFYARINASFGSMLEKLVPKAFEDMVTGDFFVKGQNS